MDRFKTWSKNNIPIGVELSIKGLATLKGRATIFSPDRSAFILDGEDFRLSLSLADVEENDFTVAVYESGDTWITVDFGFPPNTKLVVQHPAPEPKKY
ncbi:MAG TPA: hypothetical protein VMP68_13605 [Candidatus Eisenbacteria bacterium]|nr:hypothetical protein [Candidatus Eisenbacteria bacterium]